MTFTTKTTTEPGPYLVWSAPVMARHLQLPFGKLKSRVGVCNAAGCLFPVADAKVGEHRGWRPTRDNEIRAWLAGEPVPTQPPPTVYWATRDWAEQLGLDLWKVRQWWQRLGQPLIPGPMDDDEAARRNVPRPDVFLLRQPNRFDQNPTVPGWLPAREDELREFSDFMVVRAGARKRAPHVT